MQINIDCAKSDADIVNHIESNTESTRKLASIQRVESVSKHTNADSLELVSVLGWQIVTRIGEAKPDDLIVYCEIDSVLPNAEWLPNAIKSKLKDPKDKHRLKTAKIRGEISQGLIVPLHSSMNFDVSSITTKDIGTNVTDFLEITKYEPPALTGKYAMFQTNSNLRFPSDIIKKTDETRIQSSPKLLKWMKGKPYYSTVKLDGTSATYFMGPKRLMNEDSSKDSSNELSEEMTLIVCSRNQIRKRPKNLSVCPYWYIANKYNLEEKLKNNVNIAIQGEICGPNIQKNLLNLKDLDFFVFNVVDIREPGGKRFGYKESIEYVHDTLKLKFVPVEDCGDEFGYESVTPLKKVAEGVYQNSKKTREGLVFRTQDSEISFKIINDKYLLKTDQ